MAIEEKESSAPNDFAGSNEESLFARGVDGQLVRVVQATAKDLDTDVTLLIDGDRVVVKKAVPQRNSQGTILRNDLGEVIPRPTTIYDAVSGHYVKTLEDENPIPVLCHREHLNPVGVCRVCLVQIEEVRASGRSRSALVSSCTYHVKDQMVIRTLKSEEKLPQLIALKQTLEATSESVERDEQIKKITDEVRAIPRAVDTMKKSVGLVVELLATENLTSSDLNDVRMGLSPHEPNELKKLVARFVQPQTNATKFLPSEKHGKRGFDLSSEMIAVNHDACVLCQRCTRACVDIKNNDVISRTGKGYATQISFDLDLPMLESSCVSCGECVISCPTDALTFRPEIIKKQVQKLENQIASDRLEQKDDIVIENVPIAELLEDPLFGGIPRKYLEFNGGAVIRKKLKAGAILCRQGEYGATAFLIKKGKFEIIFEKSSFTTLLSGSKSTGGILSNIWSLLGRPKNLEPKVAPVGLATGTDAPNLQTSKQIDALKTEPLYRTPKDVILGEQACLNRYPRGATIKAAEDSEVIEIGSNVLYMLQRNAASRKLLNEAYRRYAMNSQLEKLPVFESVAAEERAALAKILANDVELMSVEPGQPIFREGEEGSDFYLVRLGYVKVSRQNGSREQIINYIGPKSSFGEIAALSKLYEGELSDELNRFKYLPGIRTTSCTALDHVELVRIKGSQLKQIIDRNPLFKEQLLIRAKNLLEKDTLRDTELSTGKSSFVEQGLYNAQSLLVLDLESCTRCDECTRACADTHDGKSRLVREGLRFGNFLVATSCRSCTDPYCLVGCPVNAIFREGSKEIRIEDHCIGCGLCSNNCPYGNITMYGAMDSVTDTKQGRLPIIRQKATTCDQCKSLDGDPRCVYACPHDAAYRMTGERLKEKILATEKLA
jgi:Fe-S-cluster-containing hydrogenase component 2/CRP-like cAMP-binding protein